LSFLVCLLPIKCAVWMFTLTSFRNIINTVTCRVVQATIVTGSSSDDWIY
jgi:hypothetical protein